MNKITINPNKGKWLNTKNWLKIQEVSSYCYLGVRITQSIKLDEHEMKLKSVEKALRIKIGVLNPSLVNTIEGLLFIKQLIKANYSTQQQQYVCITIDISQKYRLYYIDALKAYSVSDRILRKKRYLMYLEFQMLKKWLEELTLRI